MALIVDIDHETGDLSQYDSITGGADFSVNSSSPLTGSYDAKLVINDTNQHYGRKDFTTFTSNAHRAGFSFNPNSQAGTDWMLIFIVDLGAEFTIQIWSRKTGSNQEIHMRTGDDIGDNILIGSVVIIPNSKSWIEMRVKRESSDGANDGEAQLFVDGVSKWLDTSVQNFNRGQPYKVVVGRLSGDTTAKTVFFDDIKVRDDDVYIGPPIAGGGLVKSGLQGNLKGNLMGGLR